MIQTRLVMHQCLTRLHHSCRLHRGECNPILFGESHRAGWEEGTALRSDAFLRPLPPDFSTECHPLSPPLPPSHLFTSLNGEAARSQRASLRDHRIVRPSILIPSPLSRSETAGLFFPLHRLFPLNVLTVGICCKRASPVTCPSMFASEADLPESTLPSLPSKHTHLDFTDCH
ncbi:hypothetical protein GOODEAATRI_002380 [Goodea atripinnis]|uniref:Uncharacterized protein n=1 Tax=Goodea atripinnis TaxID=208336 RepID=A0ABV0NR61_9TELE